MKRSVHLLGWALALCGLCQGCFAGLSPQEVVVVVNNQSDVGEISRAVAEYYCQETKRNIPTANILEITTQPDEAINPFQFVYDIQVPLKSFLASRPGFDTNDPGSDPTKAIVLCYGVPSKVYGNGRACTVDSSLAPLFSDVPWGQEPIGHGLDTKGVENPYWDSHVDPAERTKPAEFGELGALLTTTRKAT